MKNRFSKMPNEAPQQARSGNASRVAAVLLFVLAVFDIFSTYNYIRSQTIQQMFAMILSYAVTASTLFCAWLIRQNRIRTAVWGLILVNLIALLLSPLLGSGLGLI